jgi:hypothetical protein
MMTKTTVGGLTSTKKNEVKNQTTAYLLAPATSVLLLRNNHVL